jgi:hypothetical protein
MILCVNNSVLCVAHACTQALELLRGAGIFSLSQSEDEWNEYFKAYGEGDGYSLDWLSLFNELCHVGSAGEMVSFIKKRIND